MSDPLLPAQKTPSEQLSVKSPLLHIHEGVHGDKPNLASKESAQDLHKAALERCAEASLVTWQKSRPRAWLWLVTSILTFYASFSLKNPPGGIGLMVAIYGLILVSTGLGFELLDRNTQLKYIKHFHSMRFGWGCVPAIFSITPAGVFLSSAWGRCYNPELCPESTNGCRLLLFGMSFVAHATISASVAWNSLWANLAYGRAVRALQQADGTVQA